MEVGRGASQLPLWVPLETLVWTVCLSQTDVEP